jgi:hypothetical protein
LCTSWDNLFVCTELGVVRRANTFSDNSRQLSS